MSPDLKIGHREDGADAVDRERDEGEHGLLAHRAEGENESAAKR